MSQNLGDRLRNTVARRAAAGLVAFLAVSSGVAHADGSSDPQALAIGEQLLEKAGVEGMMEQMLDRMEPGLIKLVQQANPGKQAEVQDVMSKFVFPKMKASLPEALKQCAGVYADHFTNGELQQLVDFYNTPLGQKLTREQPLMGAEMSKLGALWAQKSTLEAVREYSEEFKKRGLQTPI
jgi:hypothetical protein